MSGENPTDPQQRREGASAATSAIAQANALNANLLASQAERSYANLESKNQELTEKCQSHQTTIASLNDKILELQQELKIKSEESEKFQGKNKEDAKKLETSQERERDANERMARIDVEADSLRQEISRLNAKSSALAAQITELESSTTLTSSSTAPLQFENTRLKTELASLNSHVQWLESELNTRSEQVSQDKIKNAKLIQSQRQELNELKCDYDEVLSTVSTLSMQNESYRLRLENSQRLLLEKEQDHNDILHELRLEAQSERRLVALHKENIARVEERYNDAVREIKSIKALAAAAEKDREEDILLIRNDVEKEFVKNVEEVEKEAQKKIRDVQKQLDDVIMEKNQLEDTFMRGNTATLTDGQSQGQMLQLTEGEPMTLTKLYEKLADAKDEARKERAEKKRLELYLERVQKEVESAAPRQRQERKEYELAMTQNQEMHSRLNEAWEESNTVRRELQQVQRELADTSRECNELRLENKDLAKQVQTLLQKSLNGEDLAAEIQDQNNRLLKEHHRMSTTISELQEKLENDNIQQKLEELEAIKEERENQARLVTNIVQQRDLYRALLNKNDQALLTEYGADGAIVAAKDQIEKYTAVEAKNRNLEDSMAKLNADLVSMTNIKTGLEERLARLDAHSNDLSVANTRLQGELSSAFAAVARSKATAEYHVEKVTRIEDALENTRSELSRTNEEKRSLQRVNEELQSALSTSRGERSSLEEQLRQANVQVRLSTSNIQTLKEAEARLNSENASLRSELSRHVALHESMQKIEASLTTSDDTLRQKYEDDIAQLASTLSTEKSDLKMQIEKLQNLVEDANLRLQAAEKEKENALMKASESKDKLIRAIEERKTVDDKIKSLESDLNFAKIKLGEANVDKSEQEQFEDLQNELASVKAELDAANKKIIDYKSMAQTSEETLTSANTASQEIKKAALDQIKQLQSELKTATETAKMRQDALEALSSDLSSSRSEQEKVTNELKAQIEVLKTELRDAKCSQDTSENQKNNAVQELKLYKDEAQSAKNNYERELALHADARKELHIIRERLEEESRLLQVTKSKLDNFDSEFASERSAWEETKKRMAEAQESVEKRLHDAQEQNKVLHNQLATLNDNIAQIQARKVDAAVHSTSDGGEEESVFAKQISELQDVIRFQRQEKEVLETQLDSSRRNAERERAAAEIAKKSLEQLRREVDLLHKDSDKDIVEDSGVALKLKEADEQLVLLRESNKLLRNETEQLQKALKVSRTEAEEAKHALEPSSEKCRSLEVDKSALEVQKESLMKEVDTWKERVQGLVKKFNQVDPEEHAAALRSIEESKKNYAKLQAEKVKAENDTSNAKALVSRLNKEMAKQKSLLESMKSALVKANEEKEKLQKDTGSMDKAKKDMEEMKSAKEKAENDLKTATAENDRHVSRLENLKLILIKNKQKMKEAHSTMEQAVKKEKEMAKQLADEKQAHEITKSRVTSTSSNEQKEDVEMATEEKTDNSTATEIDTTKTETSSKPTDAKIPTIPTVPKEGFTFVASKTSVSAESLLPKSSTQNSNEKKEQNVTAKTQQEEAKTSTVKREESATSEALKKEKEDKLREKLRSKVKAQQDTSTTQKKEVVTPAPAKTEEVTKKNPTKKEDSLREKLMKRKRELAKKLESPAAKRVASSSSESVENKSAETSEETKTSASEETKGATKETETAASEDIKEASEEVKTATSEEVKEATKETAVVALEETKEGENEKKQEGAEALLAFAEQQLKPPSEETKTDGNTSDKKPPFGGLNANAKPFSMFGSGGNATFGSGVAAFGSGTTQPSLGFGKQVDKSGTPAFGISASSSTPAFGSSNKAEPAPGQSGGAFLNLKPPGSSTSTPFVFGSSSSITLPTPSKDKLPIDQQPFTGFQSKPFGSIPFGSAPAGGAQKATPLFGSVGKKRSLEGDEEESSTKLAKVEEEPVEEDDANKET